MRIHPRLDCCNLSLQLRDQPSRLILIESQKISLVLQYLARRGVITHSHRAGIQSTAGGEVVRHQAIAVPLDASGEQLVRLDGVTLNLAFADVPTLFHGVTPNISR
jgi:hypothetical protein